MSDGRDSDNSMALIDIFKDAESSYRNVDVNWGSTSTSFTDFDSNSDSDSDSDSDFDSDCNCDCDSTSSTASRYVTFAPLLPRNQLLESASTSNSDVKEFTRVCTIRALLIAMVIGIVSAIDGIASLVFALISTVQRDRAAAFFLFPSSFVWLWHLSAVLLARKVMIDNDYESRRCKCAILMIFCGALGEIALGVAGIVWCTTIITPSSQIAGFILLVSISRCSAPIFALLCPIYVRN